MGSPIIFGPNGPQSIQAGSLTLNGTTSGNVAINPGATPGSYNWNLPATAGTAGQLLTSQAGGSSPMTWSTAPTQLNVVSKTTTYTAAYNDYILASSSSFTITLPTAVSASGVQIWIQHNGTSLTQVYTLNTTSGQTIGGVASGSYALYTNSEVLGLISDGSNWQIIEHRTNTGWIDAGTITITATTTNPTPGTVALNKVRWRRLGDSVELQYSYNQTSLGSGASGSGTYLLALPNMTIDTTKQAVAATSGGVVGSTQNTTQCGTFNAQNSNSSGGFGLCYANDSTHIYCSAYNGSSFVMFGSGAFALGNAIISFTSRVTLPISGFQP